MHFNDCFSLPEATKDPHYLLNFIQFSQTQAGVKPITANIGGVSTELMANRFYCSGIKVCGGKECTYTVSTKQRVNRYTGIRIWLLFLLDHVHSCYIAYVYPTNTTDGRRWFVAINAENKLPLHNLTTYLATWKIGGMLLYK